MKHPRTFAREKAVVELAALGGAVVVYLALWRFLAPADPAGPAAFLPAGGAHRLLAFAVLLLGLTVVTSVLTLPARFEAALAVVLLGAGGISLRSAPIRYLLWYRETDLRAVFLALAAETAILGVMLLLTGWVLAVLRRALAPLLGHWAWQDPLEDLTDEQRRLARERIGQEMSSGSRRLMQAGGLRGPVGFVRVLAGIAADRGAAAATRRDARSPWPERYAFPAGTAGLLGAFLLFTLLRSDERGQILAAVGLSLAVGVGVARAVFPRTPLLLAFVLPLAFPLALYVLAAMAAVPGTPLAWAGVPYYARPLPVDWLTVGAGGALVGYWFGSRYHELRILESIAEEEDNA